MHKYMPFNFRRQCRHNRIQTNWLNRSVVNGKREQIMKSKITYKLSIHKSWHSAYRISLFLMLENMYKWLEAKSGGWAGNFNFNSLVLVMQQLTCELAHCLGRTALEWDARCYSREIELELFTSSLSLAHTHHKTPPHRGQQLFGFSVGMAVLESNHGGLHRHWAFCLKEEGEEERRILFNLLVRIDSEYEYEYIFILK